MEDIFEVGGGHDHASAARRHGLRRHRRPGPPRLRRPARPGPVRPGRVQQRRLTAAPRMVDDRAGAGSPGTAAPSRRVVVRSSGRRRPRRRGSDIWLRSRRGGNDVFVARTVRRGAGRHLRRTPDVPADRGATPGQHADRHSSPARSHHRRRRRTSCGRNRIRRGHRDRSGRARRRAAAPATGHDVHLDSRPQARQRGHPDPVADFTAVDEQGNHYRPYFVPGTRRAPATLHPGQRASFELRAAMPTGEGSMRWSPAGHLLALWDFVVEND